MTASKPLLTGQWDSNQTWGFYQDDNMPVLAQCTAVYCLAILPETDQVVLTRNHRGWEMLGGHIERGETIEQSLLRECIEEGGYTPESFKLFGYRKVTSKQPTPHSQKEGHFYPFPHGYLPHFIATSSLPLVRPSGEEIVESRAYNVRELESLGMNQLPIIKLMLDYYKNNL